VLTSDNRNAETAVCIRVSECLNFEKNRQRRAEWSWCDYNEGTQIGKTALRLHSHHREWNNNFGLPNGIIVVLVETSDFGLGLQVLDATV